MGIQSHTILLAHHSPLFREGLKAVLGRHEDLHVVGETDNGRDAVTLVAQLRLNGLIVDVVLPGLSGLEVTRQVHQRFRRTSVLVLTQSTSDANVLGALRQGAIGNLFTDASGHELVQAVRQSIDKSC